MSPSETSYRDGFLEYPIEALEYYRKNRVETVVCEEKHMGSRAVVVVCRDEATAKARFGGEGEGTGIIYNRTGRRVFSHRAPQRAAFARVNSHLTRPCFWRRRQSGWLSLACH